MHDAHAPHGHRQAEWLPHFVDACQVIALRLAREPLRAVLDELRTAVAALPADMSPTDRLVATGLVIDLLLKRTTGGDCRQSLMQLIDDHAANTSQAGDRTSADTPVGRALHYISRRSIGGPITLGATARHVGMSPWHLTRLLTRETGRSFLGHVHRSRVTAATQLLESTNLLIKEVAAAVGYTDSTQFCRRFRGIVGLSPARFRNQRRYARKIG